MKQLTVFEWVAVGAALAVVIYFVITGGMNVPLANKGNNQSTNQQQTMNQDTNASSTSGGNATASSVVITDTVVGTGAVAEPGKNVLVNYTGMLENGKVFDSSYAHGQPIPFQLGAGQVIPGWEKGIVGMKVGGKRHLVISPEAAYGSQSITNPQTGETIIPANATLIFDVELMDVK